MSDLYKYGVAVHLYKPIIKRGVVDFAVSADWTPVAGDVKISKDGGAAANVTNLPTAITMGNTAMWDYSITATEMQAAKVRISVADSATKAVEDTFFELDTYGNASGQHAIDLNDAVRAGLTALPNVASGSAGAIPTTGTGSNQINVSGGRADANATYVAGAAVPPRYTGTSQAATLATITLANGTTALQAAIGDVVLITSGAGLGLSATIASQTGMGTATPICTITNSAGGWATLPTASGYEILKTGGAVPADSAVITDVSARIPAALVSGRIDASVGAYQSGLTPLQPTTSGRTLDVSAAGEAGVDWANVGSPTTVVGLSGTTIKTSTDIATQIGALFTTALTESYAADGAAPTVAQALFAIQQFLQEKVVSGTTLTVKKLNGSTTAMTFTLDSATAPAAITRAT